MNGLQARAMTRMMSVALLGLAMSGCGGSDASSPTPAPTPANRAPSITSAASASTVENATGGVYQASATDADGDPVTLSLSGPDAGRFTISGTGEVRFVSPPNFEKPSDADANNTHIVEVSASDGKVTVNQTVTITVTNSKEGVDVQRVATGFSHPVAIVPVPGEGQLMVAERSGAIYTYDPATQQRTLFATVQGLAATEGQGILSIAVRPGSATGRQVYVLIERNRDVVIRQIYTAGGQTGYAEFNIGRRSPSSVGAGGWLGFGADGLLYAATEDAGGTQDPSGSAQSSTSLFGKLLSFSQLSFDIYGGAAVAPPITPTLLARGLHEPAGGAFYAGGLLLPDRGQSLREEVNALTLTPGAIDNLGWPFREGTAVLAPGEPAGLTSPVLKYPHGSDTYAGQQIVGGFVYQGSNASLAGMYVFLDASGAIFSAPLTSLQRGATAATSAFERRDQDFAPAGGTITRPVSVAQDATGAIYIACDNGDILRATAS